MYRVVELPSVSEKVIDLLGTFILHFFGSSTLVEEKCLSELIGLRRGVSKDS